LFDAAACLSVQQHRISPYFCYLQNKKKIENNVRFT
jgi:hypothetical protein